MKKTDASLLTTVTICIIIAGMAFLFVNEMKNGRIVIPTPNPTPTPTPSPSPSPSPTPTPNELTGTVLHYKFDGNTLASVGNAGTVYGSPTPTTDAKVGTGAYNFVGTTGWVNAGTSTSYDSVTSFGISTWAKMRSFRHGYIVSKMNSYTLHFMQWGNLSYAIYGGVYYSNTTAIINNNIVMFGADNVGQVVELNKWYHIVYNYDATNSKAELYLNGVLVSSRNNWNKPMPVNSAQPIVVGGRFVTDLARNFDGVIDDVRVLNRPITSTEVQQLYAMGTPAGTPLSITGVE